jgi:hypothetical protein
LTSTLRRSRLLSRIRPTTSVGPSIHETSGVAFWTSDAGIDGETPVEIDELDLIPIDPLPSYVWYQEMADFTEDISDSPAARRLAQALQGAGSVPAVQEAALSTSPRIDLSLARSA